MEALLEEVAACVPTVLLDDLEWADAIIFSVPTRFGNMLLNEAVFRYNGRSVV